jgi:hypothetical protein
MLYIECSQLCGIGSEYRTIEVCNGLAGFSVGACSSVRDPRHEVWSPSKPYTLTTGYKEKPAPSQTVFPRQIEVGIFGELAREKKLRTVQYVVGWWTRDPFPVEP